MKSYRLFIFNFHIFSFIYLISVFRIGYSVSIDYCLQPLNKSDCKVEPTPVFSYYKPGSRCEIELWRGCPTLNKFDNEYECSHFCIAKLFEFQDSNENVLTGPPSLEKLEVTRPSDPCIAVLNTTQCTQESTEVVTHKNGTCEKTIWRGCDTLNKFDDESKCLDACVKENLQQWKGKLEKLSNVEVKEIDNILDELVNETTTEKINEETTTLVADETEAPTTQAVTEETTEIITEVRLSEATTVETTSETIKPTEEGTGDADEVILT